MYNSIDNRFHKVNGPCSNYIDNTKNEANIYFYPPKPEIVKFDKMCNRVLKNYN